MRLFISIPCSNGLLYAQTAGSLVSAANVAISEGLLEDFQIYFDGKESLIHRGRDRAALMFLEGGFDKLLTIDADISFTTEDFKRIITSPHEITGGMYPIKTFPVVANFNPLPDRGTEFYLSERGYDYEAYLKFKEKYADSQGYAEVRHIPTGFMCVTRKVLADLSHTVEVYHSKAPATGGMKSYFQFYPSQVLDSQLLSEDWYFCRLASEAGFKVYLDTKISLGHIGYHEYRMGQIYGEIKP